MERDIATLICDKCGHFSWDTLADKLVRAMMRHRLTTLWVPQVVYDHMQKEASKRDESLGIPPIISERSIDIKLVYRGVEVKSLLDYEPCPLPTNPGEMYLIVERNGTFLYAWIE